MSEEQKTEWLIRKGEYFYRPNFCGYTTAKHEAGRYTKEDAEREARVEPWHMEAIHESEWPDAGASRPSPTGEKVEAGTRREIAFHLDRMNAWLRDMWAVRDIDLHMSDGSTKSGQCGLLCDIRDDVGAMRATISALVTERDEARAMLLDAYGGDASVTEIFQIAVKAHAETALAEARAEVERLRKALGPSVREALQRWLDGHGFNDDDDADVALADTVYAAITGGENG